jgi:hypothetical protein
MHTCFRSLLILTLLLSLASCTPEKQAAAPQQTALHLASDPPGATAVLDGVQIGLTPIERAVDRGPHMVEIRLPGFETHFEKIAADAGDAHVIRVKLLPQTAIVQLRSLPSGAAVKVDGNDVGQTPLMTHLAVGRHTAEFHLAGTDVKVVPFDIEDARPRRIRTDLKSVLGSATIISNPAGASIFVDGKLRGTSPLTLEDMAQGRHKVLAQLPDHHELTSQFIIRPGEAKIVRLPRFKPLPGSLVVNSVPQGASVYQQRELLGNTPLTLKDLPETRLTLRLEMTGYEPVTRSVQVRPGRTKKLEVVLDADFGGFTLTTEPPGCEIYASDQKVGVTRQAGSEFVSAAFEHNGLQEGPHAIVITHPGYVPVKRNIVILRNQVTQVGNIKLKKRWLPDHELRKTGGETLKVLLIRKLDNGTIEVEPEKGISLTYQRGEYDYIRPLQEDQ